MTKEELIELVLEEMESNFDEIDADDMLEEGIRSGLSSAGRWVKGKGSAIGGKITGAGRWVKGKGSAMGGRIKGFHKTAPKWKRNTAYAAGVSAVGGLGYAAYRRRKNKKNS